MLNKEYQKDDGRDIRRALSLLLVHVTVLIFGHKSEDIQILNMLSVLNSSSYEDFIL